MWGRRTSTSCARFFREVLRLSPDNVVNSGAALEGRSPCYVAAAHEITSSNTSADAPFSPRRFHGGFNNSADHLAHTVRESSQSNASTPIGSGSSNPATAVDKSGPKRFYKKAHARPAPEGGFNVMLDHRPLRTPAKKEIVVPTEALALALAAEWEWQESGTLRPFTMPLMKLTATCIDLLPHSRPRVVSDLLGYLHTDTLLIRAEDGDPVAERQRREWDPLLLWASKALRNDSSPLSSLASSPSATSTDASSKEASSSSSSSLFLPSSSLFPPNQSSDASDAVAKFLHSLDDWHLAAFDSLSSSARSVLVAVAVLKGRLDPGEALNMARLEENVQVEQWGFVEGGHDIDIADLTVRVSAASMFVKLLNHHER